MDSQSSNNKEPWPTDKAMKQVYEKHLWGGEGADFYSGVGSHDANILEPYVKVVSEFLNSLDDPISVCDLGCGDFNVGQQLFGHTKNYIAFDIVDDLINRNRIKFQAENLEFRCMDMADDDLPHADCAIVRQVLQHLSNAEIQMITRKLAQYKYVIVTEHLPNGAFLPNVDIISGQGIRLKKGSGVQITADPFSFSAREERELNTIELGEKAGRIVTMLYIS